jgi:hypothetical protein
MCLQFDVQPENIVGTPVHSYLAAYSLMCLTLDQAFVVLPQHILNLSAYSLMCLTLPQFFAMLPQHILIRECGNTMMLSLF